MSSTPPITNSESNAARTAPTVTHIAAFFTDSAGTIVACNPECTKLLFVEASELLGRSFSNVFFREGLKRKSDRQQLERLVLEAVEREGRYESQLCALTKSQAVLKFQVSFIRMQGNTVSPGFAVTIVPQPGDGSTQPDSEQSMPGKGPFVAREIDGTQFVLASPIMQRFMGLVDRVAGHTETVLILGETGTGKELIARTIHEASHRRGRIWVDINCAALPENLVESELFGYEKGAFSGADVSKPGLFELADKGTLFLDEIGELELHTQVKLLRVLDGQPFYRLGGHRKIRVDVRIVAATNQDLEAAVKQGRFREDLFHRLGQFQLRVPALRERPEDIVALAEHFLRLKAPAKHFAPDAISSLLSYSWPGNIRELRNLIAKVAMESPQKAIDAATISAAMSRDPAALRQTASVPVTNLESMEEQMILKALERTGGHRTLAAEQLGISRRTLSRKLKEYNIDLPAGDGASSLGFISLEQQKFFRARVQIPVTIRNSKGDEVSAQGVNLSTGGMGLDGLKEPMRFSGMIDVGFKLPDEDAAFSVKGRIVWVGDEGRVGVRFVVIEPLQFEKLQAWTNKKMKEEGWEFPA